MLRPGLRRIQAPNPSPMTFWGTNTYLVGQGAVTVIDPGPAIPAHQEAILAALAPGEAITQILVTHPHLDHSALAASLAQATGATVAAFGRATDGRSDIMRDLAAAGVSGGGEGLDHSFVPDRRLADGETLGDITAYWTPGHAAAHMSFAWQGVVFSGDLVMGWASTLVSPPDGDLSAFLASTARLASLKAHAFFPGHGAPIADPASRCAWLIAHRKSREAEVLTTLKDAPASAADLARAIYTEIDPALLPAAERNVFAHLIDLTTRQSVVPLDRLSPTARFVKTDGRGTAS